MIDCFWLRRFDHFKAFEYSYHIWSRKCLRMKKQKHCVKKIWFSKVSTKSFSNEGNDKLKGDCAHMNRGWSFKLAN